MDTPQQTEFAKEILGNYGFHNSAAFALRLRSCILACRFDLRRDGDLAVVPCLRQLRLITDPRGQYTRFAADQVARQG